ncbi:MAG: enoyl-CoA hydratase/isomerase family protein [Actinomycetota bacterium]|nr:enoyl-CoA hydratase/isomerase family protein [Actinomycetota bacterium]
MPLVEVERGGGFARVVLNRPEQRNAVSTGMLEELVKAFGDLAVEPDARAVVLAGKGRDFCAGADFDEITIMRPPGFDYGRTFEEAVAAIADHPVPVIAQVHGAALGAGCQIAVGCDLAVAAEDARFGIPVAKLGLLINFENIQRLVLAVGSKRAGEILFAGRQLSGTEAAEWGLVNEAVAEPRLADRAEALARAIAEGAPLSIRGSKRGIRAVLQKLSVDRSTEAHRVTEYDMMAAAVFDSDDLKEGIKAFRERRKPDFRGT